MSKKTILILLGFAFLFNFRLAFAGVVINEIQLSPTEERFIELYNQDSAEVDLTNWYIQRKTSTGSSFGSLVSKTYFENKKISPNGYFLISRSPMEKADIILSSLTLTESNVIQIKNQNGEVIDKICFGDVSDCGESRISNPAEGQSVQRNQSNSLIIGTPTPGVQNYNSVEILPASNNSSGSSSSSSSTQSTTQPKTAEIQKIKTKITAKTLAFVGIPIEFSASTTGHSNELLNYGKYFWNFGDGDSKETRANDTTKFTHTFFYEGEYTVALEYYQNYYSESPDASDEITIKIIPANVSIFNVGDEKDFFVEISNDTDYDADISKWILSSSQKSFTLPKNMILESKKKIILSPKITGFSILDKDTLKLLNSQWETIFEYSTPITPIKILTPKSTPVKVSITENNTETEMPDNNLEAAVVKSDTDTGNNLMYGIGLFTFLGLSTSAAYFVRVRSRKIIPGVPGGDFKIIDE